VTLRFKFNSSKATFKWRKAGKFGWPCENCHKPMEWSLCVLEDFVSIGTVNFCSECREEFRRQHLPRSRRGTRLIPQLLGIEKPLGVHL
jgi:hypothetical protein